jgi:uncharacterized membrane protein
MPQWTVQALQCSELLLSSGGRSMRFPMATSKALLVAGSIVLQPSKILSFLTITLGAENYK